MKNAKAIEILHRCAAAYRDRFLGRTLMFIGFRKSSGKTFSFEVTFDKSNFQHLTGVRFSRQKQGSPSVFFDACISGRLTENEICLSQDGNTQRKLEVLPNMLESSFLNARMLGSFNRTGIALSTSVLAGGEQACMGFTPREEKRAAAYAPNTVLKGNVKTFIIDDYRVVAVCRKQKEDDGYSERLYAAKNVSWEKVAIPGSVKALFTDCFLETEVSEE